MADANVDPRLQPESQAPKAKRSANSERSANGIQGETALHKAIVRGHEGTVKLLLDCGADVNLPNHHGKRPLHLAVQSGNMGITQVLIGAGADLEAPDACGERPLHLAAASGHDHVAHLLLQHGAHVDAQDCSGRFTVSGYNSRPGGSDGDYASSLSGGLASSREGETTDGSHQ